MSFSNKLIKEKNGSRYGRMIHPWLRQKADMIADSPSRRDGMTYEEELSKRQQGGVFIFHMVAGLTQGKGEHGLSGVAASLFNRFFNIHSFKKCDFRDVAAACVFLGGKNEDTPKKLKYVVNQLWTLKYPQQKHFPSEATFLAQCDVVTFLEEILLKTVSFDINVDLPHQYVLKLMRDVEKGRNVYKEMVKTAYYMATDVLIITDWSVRYSCASVATACVNIASFFHNIKMDDIVPLDFADKWYCFDDDTMTRGEVDVMTREFLDIYARNPQFHIGSLRKIDINNKVKIVPQRSPHHLTTPPQQTPPIQPSSSSSNLKKLDMEAYKGRQKTLSGSGVAPVDTTTSPAIRQSFLPDVKNQKVVERGMMEHAAQQKQYHEAAAAAHQQRHHNHPSSSSAHHRSHNHQQQQKHHQYDESRAAKRPQEYEDPNVFSSKKSRMDRYNQQFVAASSSTMVQSTTTTTKIMMENNGFAPNHAHFSQITQESSYARQVRMVGAGPPPPPPPPPQQQQPVPLMSMVTQPPPPPPLPHIPQIPQMMQRQEPQSEYQKMCMQLDKSRNPQYIDSGVNQQQQQQPMHQQYTQHHQMMSSTQQISPPDESSPPLTSSVPILLPPPPPPPVLMPRCIEEIEEGELV
ncbi:hypothetical protein L5515_005517 [Caenorhabditis briggsae]|uniref:Protein CBR-CIT-1.2 n=1 Tax=Caenorhabditis briggsae TaxID=6238 RepID=A0AAE9ENN1_CAEBR|nr:hypothetical protein L5515_005517 [Caenorhabditis briggsae]